MHVLRWHRWDEGWQTIRTGVYGYQAECPCGWAGERRQVISTAKRDLRAHHEWVVGVLEAHGFHAEH